MTRGVCFLNCKICQSSDLKILEIQDKYYYCNNCEFVFLSPDQIIDAAAEKERYQGHDNNHQNEGYVKMFEKFIEEVIEANMNLKKGSKVLDFGCGPGPVLADLLAEKEADVEIYDPYFYPQQDFKKKKYDLITATEVFEHFSDPIKELKLLSSLLKEEGYLAVMTSFHPGPEELEEWWYKWDPTHIVFYNQQTFKKIASMFNFKIIYTNQENYVLFKLMRGREP